MYSHVNITKMSKLLRKTDLCSSMGINSSYYMEVDKHSRKLALALKMYSADYSVVLQKKNVGYCRRWKNTLLPPFQSNSDIS